VKVTNRRIVPAAVAAAALLLGACDDGSNDATSELNKQGAAVMCQDFIKKDERIKSPGSLKFSGVSSTKIEVLHKDTPWQYKVTGYIDSQNDFGAYKRNSYVCTVTTANGDSWHLNELNFTTHH
jgi:hypothetical protein